MRAAAFDIIGIAFFVAVGWVALWPMRRRLGAVPYHLAALPTGLLSAPIAGAVSTVSGRPLDAFTAVAGAALFVAALWTVQRVVLGPGRTDGSPVGMRSFAAAAGVLALLGAGFGLARYTVANYDSIVSYWPLGVELSRKGAFTVQLLASRSQLIPSMNAVFATFGSDYAYLVYPLLGATVALWLAMTLWRGPLSGSSRATKRLVAGGTLAFLVIEPSFIFHSFLVHSHMASAVYLLMSATCMWMGFRPDATGEKGDGEAAYLVLAGVFAAGLALARPDGLAYQFVPVAVAISVLTLSKVRWRSVAAFFAPLLFVVFASYAAAYARLGMWPSSKLSGRTALAILALLALSAAGPWIVEALDRLLPFRVSGGRFIGVLTAASAVLMVIVFALKWGSARPALVTTGINLFLGAGGYNYLWYAVVALLVISLFTHDALRTGSWTRWAFLAVALFFVVSGFIFGTSHEGRIGVGDSFNRVVFEVFPLVVWYVAAVVARILHPAALAADADDARDERA